MFKQLGAMRIVLYVTVLIFLPMVLIADVDREGWGFVPAILAPTLIIIFFFVLLLDALMSRVFMIEQPDEVRARLRLAVRMDLLMVLLILVIWGPFYYRLVTAL